MWSFEHSGQPTTYGCEPPDGLELPLSIVDGSVANGIVGPPFGGTYLCFCKKHEACLSKTRALFLPNMLRVFTQQIVSLFILVIGVFRCHPHPQGLYQRDLFTQYYLFWKRWKLCNSRKTLFQKLIHRHYIKSREWQRFQHIKMSIFRNYKICTSCKSTINKFIIIRICSNKP